MGFVAGLAMVALAATWLNGLGQPPLEEGVPAPAPSQPLVSAIDSAACRDRAVGAQYAMVCVDSQLLNTDDPAACDPFGGPYQIIVCPDPSQVAMGDTRPTLAAGVGSVILPLPPEFTAPPPDSAADLPTPTPTGPGGAVWLPDDADGIQATAEPLETPGELPPATPTVDPRQSSPGLPAATESAQDAAQPTPSPFPDAVSTPTLPPTFTPLPTDFNPVEMTATPTVTPTSSELSLTPSVTPTPTLTPVVEVSVTPSPVITLPAEGYVLAGAGQQTTPGLLLTSTRLLLVRLAYNGAGNVAVSVRGADGSAGRLMLQAASLPEKSGVIDIPIAGVYFVDVSTTSGGAWTLTVSQPVPPPETPFAAQNHRLAGRGDQATSFVRLHRAAVAIRFEHAGTGNFAVTLYDAETGRPVGPPLAQAMGPFQRTETVSIPREGIYMFDVTATDAWSITIQ